MPNIEVVNTYYIDLGKTTDIKNANGYDYVSALSLNERKIYDKLDDDVK
ncbi:8969_t:CDS:2, partial [Gigaspora margarita]